MDILVNEGTQHPTSVYHDAVSVLLGCGCDFMIGGGFALSFYTGIQRDTKDLDVFCQPKDYPYLLNCLADNGFRVELTDSRWLAKVFKGACFIDIIFDTVNGICRVDETWFAHKEEGDFLGLPTAFIAPEELIWCKIYVQNRERTDILLQRLPNMVRQFLGFPAVCPLRYVHQRTRMPSEHCFSIGHGVPSVGEYAGGVQTVLRA